MYKAIPSADLRNKYIQISELVKENHQPIILTRNGKSDLVVMSIDFFEEMELELEFYKTLAENRADIANGKYKTGEQVGEFLKKHIKNDNTKLINELEEKYTPKLEKKNV